MTSILPHSSACSRRVASLHASSPLARPEMVRPVMVRPVMAWAELSRAMLRQPLMWVICLIWCQSLFAQSLFAQSRTNPTLDIQVERLVSVRSEAPIQLRVRMTPAAKLLEGKLEFKLWNGQELLSTLTSNDEAINAPFKTARYVLPAPDLRSYTPQIDLTIAFITHTNERLEFGPFPIIVPLNQDRDRIVCSVAPETTRFSPQVDQYLNALKFEALSPIDRDRSVRTIFSRLPPNLLPPDTISYCGFDILFLAEGGFAAIKESQWAPIVEWVEAGGSLCLLPGDNLSPHHIELLNRLLTGNSAEKTVAITAGNTAGNNAAGPFELGAENQLVVKESRQQGRIFLLRRGLGVLAIAPLTSTETLTFKPAEWARAVVHLWRLRADQTSHVLGSGKWNPAVMARQSQALEQLGQRAYFRHLRPDDRQLAYSPINSGDEMISAIIPSNLRVVPLALIAFVLFLYVLAIGPGDYFILGRLNLRRWTWVTFPVTTLLFAGGALLLAEWYMNTGDARRSTYVVDVGIEGQPERVNQFEMLFNSRQRIAETSGQKCLFTPLEFQAYGTNSYFQYSRRQFDGAGGFVGPAEISGRIPTQFVARQLTPKWVPQLNRMLSVNTDKFQNQIDWPRIALDPAISWAERLEDADWIRSVVDPILNGRDQHSVSIQIFAGNRHAVLHGSADIFHHDNTPPNNSNTSANLNRLPPIPNQAGSRQFLADISVLQDAGLFSVVHAISPHGGRQLEDLSLLDPSNERQCLLIVAFADGQDWIIYRKLYAGIE